MYSLKHTALHISPWTGKFKPLYIANSQTLSIIGFHRTVSLTGPIQRKGSISIELSQRWSISSRTSHHEGPPLPANSMTIESHIHLCSKRVYQLEIQAEVLIMER